MYFHFRRPQYLFRYAELVCTYCYVFLLHGGGDGPQISEVHMVEEVPNLVPNGAIRGDFHASVPAAVQGLRLPEGVHGLDWAARNHVPVPVLGLLQGQVLGEGEGERSRKTEWRRYSERGKSRSMHGTYVCN